MNVGMSHECPLLTLHGTGREAEETLPAAVWRGCGKCSLHGNQGQTQRLYARSLDFPWYTVEISQDCVRRRVGGREREKVRLPQTQEKYREQSEVDAEGLILTTHCMQSVAMSYHFQVLRFRSTQYNRQSSWGLFQLSHIQGSVIKDQKRNQDRQIQNSV